MPFAQFEGIFVHFVQNSTPDKIEHCIVWGKEFYGLLFGDRTASLLYEEVDSVYMHSIDPSSPEVIKDRVACLDFCITLMQNMFDKEIEKRILIGTYATSEHKPIPLNVLQNVDKQGISEGVYRTLSENYETIWNTKQCINILLTWLVQYYMEEKHVVITHYPLLVEIHSYL